MCRLNEASKGDLRRVLAALSAGLGRASTDRDLPSIFEQQVQEHFSMRAVRLREVPARYHARLVTPTRTSESIVLGVPTANPRTQAVLEASFDPGRRLDEDDFAALATAAQLGGLVLEAARVRTPPRAALPDGAAPLIGSTALMQSLRDRVEQHVMDVGVVLDRHGRLPVTQERA